MQAIYKYPIKLTEAQMVPMPEGALILDIQEQRGEWFLWAVVDPAQPARNVPIYLRGTGQEASFSGLSYLCTRLSGNFVWHWFVKAQQPVFPRA